jgi:Domain of unknown function (DUF4294)
MNHNLFLKLSFLQSTSINLRIQKNKLVVVNRFCKNLIVVFVLLNFTLIKSFAQDTDTFKRKSFFFVNYNIINGDTVPYVTLKETTISANRKASSKKYQREYDKIMRNVIKTYPYARIAGDLIKEFDIQMAKLDNDLQKKYYLKAAEEKLKKEFEGELKKMTVSQGKVLIKLIDRETGNTSYELIQELKGNFSAFMWQGLARIFGENLKDDYDPIGEDAIIEEIVLMIERGEISVNYRKAQTVEAQNILDNRKKRLNKKQNN